MSNEITTSTIEVRLRKLDEERSRHLFVWPVDKLEDAIATVGRWGIRDDEETGTSYGADSLSGEFVAVDGRAYFEILLDADAA